MSVPEGKRGESKFEVLVKAKELACYTIKICCNKNIFKDEYQNALTNDIIHNANQIFILSWTANNVKVITNDDLNKRKAYQNEACECCNNLLAEMQIAQSLFHLKSKRIAYWGQMTIDVRNLIRKWRESDRKRHLNL